MAHVIHKYLDEHVTLRQGSSPHGPQDLCTTCMMIPQTKTLYLKQQVVDLGVDSQQQLHSNTIDVPAKHFTRVPTNITVCGVAFRSLWTCSAGNAVARSPQSITSSEAPLSSMVRNLSSHTQ